MRSRENIASAKEARLMDTEELRAYTSLGRNNAIKFGEKIEAKVKIGRRVLWDRKKVDQYFDSLTGVK
jgi:predicted DNA-binding transcriptional regulator AlpA